MSEHDPTPTTIPAVIAALDAAMEELRALRRRVEELQFTRDEWRARSEWR
jgi:hypothetical protein